MSLKGTEAGAASPGSGWSDSPSLDMTGAHGYQWLMYLDAGVEAIRHDPVGFARIHHRVVLDGVGHFPHREAAESVAEHVHQLLNRHRS